MVSLLHNVVVSEDLWWPLPEAFQTQYHVYYEPELHKKPEQLQSAIVTAQALVIRNRTRITASLLEQAPNLRVIGRLGVGLDNIDLQACRAHHVKVIAAKGCNANSVAEYVIAGLFEHARALHEHSDRTKSGQWHRQQGIGTEISGKTLGLIGVGDIGQRVAVRARALGLKVIAYDPFVVRTHMLVQDFGMELLSDINDVMAQSDYISLHVPLTSTTHHLIDETRLARVKPSAVLINTSRGGIVDESALLKALSTKSLGFAVLDVREQEPPTARDPLAQLPNVLLTPHIAGITQESSRRVAEFILAEIDRAFRGEPVQGEV
jgi:D-3-phosphoglycerate dehydrogenase